MKKLIARSSFPANRSEKKETSDPFQSLENPK